MKELLFCWWLTAVGALVALLCNCSGCGTLTLRPVQSNHALRKTEVTARLGVSEETLNSALAGEQAECDLLDGRVTFWTASAIVVGGLGGGAGLTTSILSAQTPRWITGSISLFFGATAALSGYLSTRYSSLYSHRCAVNMGGR